MLIAVFIERVGVYLKIVSNFRQNYIVFLINSCGAVTALVYTYIVYSQQQGQYIGLNQFLSLEIILVAVWLTAYSISKPFDNIALLLFWAVIFRVIGIWGEPLLEDDWYRYLWDGYRFVVDGTPYGVSPAEYFAADLPGNFSEILGQINNPELPTIYGPTLQYLFALAYLISPGELWGLKLIMLVVDLSLIVILLKFASVSMVLLYAWCPLVIKEIAFTAHPDGIGVFLLMAALVLRWYKHVALAVIVAAMAVAAKVFAVLVVPWVLWRLSIKYWFMFALVLLVLYAPFVLQGSSDFFSLFEMARRWEFNPVVFGVLNTVLSDTTTKLVLGSLFIMWLVWYFFRSQAQSQQFSLPRADWVYGLFLFISPVINAWYWLWVLPFAVLFPSFWAWTASVALFLSYVVGLHIPGSELAPYEMPLVVRLIEFSLIAAALIFDYKNRKISRREIDQNC